MKKKFILTVSVLLIATGCAVAATNDTATLLQRGLFEEEANHHLDTAIGDYKEVIEQFDRERQLAATAIFRLGECYRKQGKTNEANVQYERIVREFPDQPQLAQLSRAYLPASGGAAPASATEFSTLPPDEETFLREVKESVQNSPDLVNQQLIQAVAHGYVSAAEFLLTQGADVNRASPIVGAAQQGNEAMVQLLLSRGADVNGHGYDSNGNTPLHAAVARGFMAVCRTLVAHGANVNATDRDGATPLELAVENGNLVATEFLLANKAQVDARRNGGKTLLAIAINKRQRDMVKLLLDHHADANMESIGNPPGGPLQRYGGRTALRRGNGQPESERSPLSLAISQPEIVELLLKAQADPNAAIGTSSFGETPLMQASFDNQTNGSEVVQMLLDHGAKVNAGDVYGRTPLAFAIMGEKIDAVRKLIEHGADVNFLDKQGAPPLSYLRSPFTETGRQIEELLIKAGADANYNRRRGIWVSDAGGTPKAELFQLATNSINHFTLLEFLAILYEADRMNDASDGQNPNANYPHYDAMVSYPDFARVAIHRLEGKRAELLHVNVMDILQSGDCSKNVALQAGDMVEIPEQEHPLALHWPGLSAEDVTALNKCLLRTVRVVRHGKSTDVALAPSFADASSDPGVSFPGRAHVSTRPSYLTAALEVRKTDILVRSFLLSNVAHDPTILLNTSDLSRVRLTHGSANMTFDLTSNPAPEVWLEDGDVVEIPELGEAAQAK